MADFNSTDLLTLERRIMENIESAVNYGQSTDLREQEHAATRLPVIEALAATLEREMRDFRGFESSASDNNQTAKPKATVD